MCAEVAGPESLQPEEANLKIDFLLFVLKYG
jgi:hypothetical protein